MRLPIVTFGTNGNRSQRSWTGDICFSQLSLGNVKVALATITVERKVIHDGRALLQLTDSRFWFEWHDNYMILKKIERGKS
jgi:hypothetical protein